MLIANVTFKSATAEQARGGLLGWVSCTLDSGLRLDGITLRRTADDRLALSFPARTDRQGQQHPFIRPVDDRTRREIEFQVFRALGLDETCVR